VHNLLRLITELNKLGPEGDVPLKQQWHSSLAAAAPLTAAKLELASVLTPRKAMPR